MKAQDIISVNPGKSYAKIGHVPISTHTEVDVKVAQARAAQASWSAIGVKARINHLEALYRAFKARSTDIAQCAAQEMGMPVTVSDLIDVGIGLRYMRGYLDNAEQWLAPQITYEDSGEIHYLFFEPKGVVGASIPWNYPFCNFIWAVIPILLAGNTIVFKHSEECPLTGKLLEDIMKEAHLPHAIAHQVYGDGSDVGEYLMRSDLDLIFFTGSTAVGKHLYQVAAQKLIPVTLELGGSAPGIIFHDADLPMAIESVYFNRYINSGQSCDALKRLIVDKRIFNDVVDGLKALLATKKIGDPLDPTTDLGPLVSERQLVRLEEQVANAVAQGATVVTGAKRASAGGAYYEPTMLTDITFDMQVWKEEVFGPVLPIVPFSTEDEAVALASDTPYGLGGYVYTESKERATRICGLLKTGNINVNNASYMQAQDPFGGYKNSGIGREHGWLGLRELCSAKVVAFKK